MSIPLCHYWFVIAFPATDFHTSMTCDGEALVSPDSSSLKRLPGMTNNAFLILLLSLLLPHYNSQAGGLTADLLFFNAISICLIILLKESQGERKVSGKGAEIRGRAPIIFPTPRREKGHHLLIPFVGVWIWMIMFKRPTDSYQTQPAVRGRSHS